MNCAHQSLAAAKLNKGNEFLTDEVSLDMVVYTCIVVT